MNRAPLFTLADASGTPFSLANHLGKYVLIYFYPRALTPGCTMQACNLNSGLTELTRRGIFVVGISTDTPKTLAAFADKYGLRFPLLSDPDHVVCEAYGAWGQKTNYGKTYFGIKRCSFMITPQGDITHVWHNVKPATHYGDVITWFDKHIACL